MGDSPRNHTFMSSRSKQNKRCMTKGWSPWSVTGQWRTLIDLKTNQQQPWVELSKLQTQFVPMSNNVWPGLVGIGNSYTECPLGTLISVNGKFLHQKLNSVPWFALFQELLFGNEPQLFSICEEKVQGFRWKKPVEGVEIKYSDGADRNAVIERESLAGHHQPHSSGNRRVRINRLLDRH